MAKRGQHSFLKRQKEIKRKEEAAGKMARRQGKVERADTDGGDGIEAPGTAFSETGGERIAAEAGKE
jgi:hypothetical protein